MVTTQEFLTHHGVKGMRWGVRKDRRSSKGGSSSGPTKPKAHELTDEDLKKAIERMNLEQQYSTLAGHVKPPKAGSTSTQAFIADLGKGLAKNAVNAAGNHVIKKALKTT